MIENSKLSKELLSFLKLIATFFILSLFFRVLFFYIFKNTAEVAYTSDQIKRAFLTGIRFDFRAAVLLSLPFWFLGYVFKTTNAVFEEKNSSMFFSSAPHPTRVLRIIYALVISLYTLFFFLDIGFYDYLKNRIDASAVIFLKNPQISYQMITESYPAYLVVLLILLIFLGAYFALKHLVFNKNLFVTGERIFKTHAKIGVPIFLILAVISHGRISQYPLRWSDAFFSSNSFVSALGINPLLYFYDTYSFKEKDYSIEKVKEHYDQVAQYLGVESPNKAKLDFSRQIKARTDAFDSPPHVVVIMMESLASFKMKHFGQKMNGTPFLDSLIPESLFFENAYVLSTGTARSIFGVITGLPDLNSVDTASRNPLLVKQYSAANAFADYSKSYFIGGSAAWGNIRGFVSQSVEDIKIYEEADFSSGKNDVWGISDLQLFREAHEHLSEKSKDQKQFMFIQTAGYHRPYTIPSDKGSFELKELTEQEIEDNGFVNNEEYNSLRFSDYALSEFFKMAEQSDYFKNTLFVIYADHGLSHFKSQTLAEGMKAHRLPIMHIPLLFYSPSLKLKPKVYKKVAFAPDILPSAVSLAGLSFENRTLGRNLFDPTYDSERYALTVSSFSSPITLRIHDENWLAQGNPRKFSALFPYRTPEHSVNKAAEQVELKKRMESLAQGLYETTKYLYYKSAH
jgi:phosphoglycerol transferase MdoB-like AlkP superfamily enzyme